MVGNLIFFNKSREIVFYQIQAIIDNFYYMSEELYSSYKEIEPEF